MDLPTESETKNRIIRISLSPVCAGDKQYFATDVPI
jgi:hypothetical protein